MTDSATPAAVRRARIAVAALFFTNGAIFASIVPRFPEIKASLGMSETVYGLAVASFPLGALLAGLAAASLVRRFGSASVAMVTTALTALAVFGATLAPGVLLLATGLFLGGAMDAVTDVAQNAQGMRVQRALGRSIINSLHAMWSVGAVTGGALAALAISVGLPPSIHLAITGGFFLIVAVGLLPFSLRGRDPRQDNDGAQSEDRRRGLPGVAIAALLALVVISIAGTLVEDAGSSWAALYLGGELGATATMASWGFIATVGAQFIGRMSADVLVDRFGQRAVARMSCLLVVLGMLLVVLAPGLPVALVGFALAGFGSAPLIPLAMDRADNLPGLAHGTGLTIVAWLLRVGFLAGPPVVGIIADASSIRMGLVITPVLGLLALLLCGVFLRRGADQRP